MEPKDFFKLKIGDTVYLEGVPCEINVLQWLRNVAPQIGFMHKLTPLQWDDCYEQLSFDPPKPPKPKVKYYGYMYRPGANTFKLKATPDLDWLTKRVKEDKTEFIRRSDLDWEG